MTVSQFDPGAGGRTEVADARITEAQAGALSGVYLIGPERVAVIPVEQAATMVAAAEFIEAQGRGPRDRLAAMAAFATRLREAMEVAMSSAVRLDIDPAEGGIAVFLLSQARARAAVAKATRQRHYCETCGKSWVTNPDYEKMVADRQKREALMRSGGMALFSGGASAFVTTNLIFAFRESNPDRSCRYCQGLETEQSVVVFCPQCKGLYDKAVLGKCGKCDYDFLRVVDLGDVWRPLAETPIPAPAGEKLTEFHLDDEPTFIAFDGCGRMLTASQARSVQLWDVRDTTREPVGLWRADAGGIVKVNKPCVAFSADGQLVATGKPMSRSFRLLRGADGAQIGRVDWAQVDGWGPNGLAIAPRSDAVAVSFDCIDVWQASPAGLGQRLTRIKIGFWTSFESIAFSPAGDLLAGAGGKLSNNTLFVWHTANWAQVAKIPAQGGIAALAWSPTPGLLALAVGPSARLVEVPSGRVVGTFAVEANVRGVAFSPDGMLLAVASEDLSARVFHLGTGAEIARVSRPAPVTAVAFAPDGSLAVGDGAHTVQFWTPSSG